MKKIKDLISLKNRKALITGSSGFLGSAICHTLSDLGSDIILVDHPKIDQSKLKKSLILKKNIKVYNYQCDLQLESERDVLIKKILKEHKKLNILINNAAFTGKSKLKGWATTFENQSIDSWRNALEVNLTAPFHLSQGLFSLMKKSIGANIINIGSVYGKYAPDWSMYKDTNLGNPAAYAASKGGLIQLTRWLSTTLAPNIRVNSISPGGIFRNQSKKFVDRYEDKTPLKRMAHEDDFIGVISFLSSDMSKYMTGQNLLIDGGWGVW